MKDLMITKFKSNLTKLNLIFPTFVINNSSSKITHEIENKTNLLGSLNWRFDQKLNIFDNISINKAFPTQKKENFQLLTFLIL